MKKIYSDLEKPYIILEFRRSHSQMVIRCLKSEIEKRDYNIDILFKPVRRMVIPDTFDGIEIFVLEEEEIPNNLICDYKFVKNHDYKTFLLKDKTGNKYYINALIAGVYYNHLGTLDSGFDGFIFKLGERKLLFNGDEFE